MIWRIVRRVLQAIIGQDIDSGLAKRWTQCSVKAPLWVKCCRQTLRWKKRIRLVTSLLTSTVLRGLVFSRTSGQGGQQREPEVKIELACCVKAKKSKVEDGLRRLRLKPSGAKEITSGPRRCNLNNANTKRGRQGFRVLDFRNRRLAHRCYIRLQDGMLLLVWIGKKWY